jgi:UDP-N-acetylmuramate: L-alanyl-gamma-D-glutamyl-meso-diaminopimelate ligase
VGSARIVAVLEPRSNTMRMGVHRETLGPSLAAADEVWLYAPPDLGWDVAAAVSSLGARAHLAQSIDQIVAALPRSLKAGDQVLVMSNGGFGGLHDRLLAALRSARQAASGEGR